MIFSFFKLILILLLIGSISTLISFTEGRTRIDWLGWGINLETSHFIMILTFIFFLLIFFDRLWRYLISFPKAALLRRDKRNREKVEKNLVKAFLLASHGEYKKAAKEALLISKNTQDKQLGLLIKQHFDAVEMQNENIISSNEFNKSSNKYLEVLSKDKNTSYIGHLAVMRIEIAKNKNINKIYEHANEAYKLEPNSEQVVKILFYTSIQLKKIKRALEISKNPIIKSLYSENKFKNILSDLYYLDGLNKMSSSKKEAEICFKRSVENFEGNILAVLNLVKLLKGISAKNKSINILKKGFFISPHEDLLNELIKKYNFKTSGEKVSSAISLIKSEEIKSQNIDEVKIQVASFCIKQKIWGEAKKILEDIGKQNLTNLALQLLAEISNSQNKPEEVRDYLKQSASAKLNFGYYCSNCGHDNKEWLLNCKNCNEISSIRWMDQPSESNLNRKFINYN